MNLHQWAIKWSIPAAALADLQAQCGLDGTPGSTAPDDRSEAAVQQTIRLEASKLGNRLWRNNVGAAYTSEGMFLRYGLLNDSAQINAVVKSSDLIGIGRRVCRCGQVHGVFLAREVKRAGWRYSDTPHEQAQRRFIDLVNSLGGDAAFCTGPGSMDLTAPST